VSEAQAQIDALNEQAEVISERYNGAQIALDKAHVAVSAANAAAAKAHDYVAGERLKFNTFAANAYRSGGASQALVVVLTEKDPTTAMAKMATLKQLGAEQSTVLTSLRTADVRYRQALSAAAQANAKATAISASLKKQEQQIKATLAKSEQVLAQLTAAQRTALLAAQQAKLAVEQARAASALASLQRTQAAQAASRAAARTAKPLVAAPRAVAVPKFANGSTIAQRAVAAAMSRLGKRYVYGAGGPNTFDCSGLVQWSYRQAGVSTAHYTGSFWSSYRHIPMSQLRPGDLVFFYRDVHHVGIYIGGGMMIHAPHTGDVVRVASVSGHGSYAGAVRVVG
jgi:cell wall-associated NlpC family hydrolase